MADGCLLTYFMVVKRQQEEQKHASQFCLSSLLPSEGKTLHIMFPGTVMESPVLHSLSLTHLHCSPVAPVVHALKTCDHGALCHLAAGTLRLALDTFQHKLLKPYLHS